MIKALRTSALIGKMEKKANPRSDLVGHGHCKRNSKNLIRKNNFFKSKTIQLIKVPFALVVLILSLVNYFEPQRLM